MTNSPNEPRPIPPDARYCPKPIRPGQGVPASAAPGETLRIVPGDRWFWPGSERR